MKALPPERPKDPIEMNTTDQSDIDLDVTSAVADADTVETETIAEGAVAEDETIVAGDVVDAVGQIEDDLDDADDQVEESEPLEGAEPSLADRLVEAARRSAGWRTVAEAQELEDQAVEVDIEELDDPADETEVEDTNLPYLGFAPAGCPVEPTWRTSFIESATRALRAEHLDEDAPDRPDPAVVAALDGVLDQLVEQAPALVVASIVRLKDTLPVAARSAGRGLHPAVAAAALSGLARSIRAAIDMMGGAELFGPLQQAVVKTADARCVIDQLDRSYVLIVVVDREHADEEAALDRLLGDLGPAWSDALTQTPTPVG